MHAGSGHSGGEVGRSRTKQRALSWGCAGGGARHVPHVASTAWKQEAGKVADRGPPGAGVPRGGEWRSTPMAEEEHRLLWLVDSVWAGAHLPVLPVRVMLRILGRRDAEAGPL